MSGDLSKYDDAAEKLLENYSAEDIAAALLKELSNDSEVKVTITLKPSPLPGQALRRPRPG